MQSARFRCVHAKSGERGTARARHGAHAVHGVLAAHTHARARQNIYMVIIWQFIMIFARTQPSGADSNESAPVLGALVAAGVCVSVCLNCVIYPPPRATAAAATKPICVHCACVAAAAVARMLYGRYRRHNDVPSVLCVALWHAIC